MTNTRLFAAHRIRRHAGCLPNGHRLRQWVHPVAWYGPVVGSVVTLLAWTSVAHSSGSGRLQAVGALLAAVLITGLVAPFFPARRVRLSCTQSPSDTVAGQRVSLTMMTNGPNRIRPLLPTGPDARSVGRARGPRQVTVEMTDLRRGVVESVVIEVASSAPFGMLWWAREMTVQLPRPLYIAPRLGDIGDVDRGYDDDPGDALRRMPTMIGEARGLRPYVPGDPRRSVHWLATSHTGTLMVNETENPSRDPVTVEVSLPSDPDLAEQEAERMMAVVAGYLSRGVPVIVSTLEKTGPTVRPVLDRIDLGRRLARAVPCWTDDCAAPMTVLDR